MALDRPDLGTPTAAPVPQRDLARRDLVEHLAVLVVRQHRRLDAAREDTADPAPDDKPPGGRS
jgi:hypothetical protein